MLILSWRPLEPQTQSKRDLAFSMRAFQEIRHELIMLPNYSMFDNLEFEIKQVDTVILSGQVTRPTLKSAAESTIRGLEGVGKVVNKIELLPALAQRRSNPSCRRIAPFSKPGLDR